MDVKNLCRTCAGNPNPGVSLLDPKQQNLAKWAQSNIASVKLNDGLSQTICLHCVEQIHEHIMFRGNFRKAQRKLATRIKSSTKNDNIDNSVDLINNEQHLISEMSNTTSNVASTSYESPKKKTSVSNMTKKEENLVKKYKLKTLNITLVRLGQETINKYLSIKNDIETIKIKNKPGPKKTKIKSVIQIKQEPVDIEYNIDNIKPDPDIVKQEKSNPEPIIMNIETQRVVGEEDVKPDIHAMKSALREELSKKISKTSKEPLRKKRKYTKKVKPIPETSPAVHQTPPSKSLETSNSPSKLPEQKITLTASSSQNSAIVTPFNATPSVNKRVFNDDSSNLSTIDAPVAPVSEQEEISTQTSLPGDDTENSQTTQDSTSNLDSQVSQDATSQATSSISTGLVISTDDNTSNTTDSNITSDSQNTSENVIFTSSPFHNSSNLLPVPVDIQNNVPNENFVSPIQNMQHDLYSGIGQNPNNTYSQNSQIHTELNPSHTGYAMPVSNESIHNNVIQTEHVFDNNISRSSTYVTTLDVEKSQNSGVQTENLNHEGNHFKTSYNTPIQSVENQNLVVQNDNLTQNLETYITPMSIQPISRVDSCHTYNENQSNTYVTPVLTNHNNSYITLEPKQSTTNESCLYSSNNTTQSTGDGTYTSTGQSHPSQISSYVSPVQSQPSNITNDNSSNYIAPFNDTCVSNYYTPVQNPTYYENSIQNIPSQRLNNQSPYFPPIQPLNQNTTQNSTSYNNQIQSSALVNQTGPTYIPPLPVSFPRPPQIPTPSTSYITPVPTKNTIKNKSVVTYPSAKPYLKTVPKKTTKKDVNIVKRPSPINPVAPNIPVRPIVMKKVVATSPSPVPQTTNTVTSQSNQRGTLQLTPNSLYRVQTPNIITPFYQLNSDLTTQNNMNFSPYVSTQHSYQQDATQQSSNVMNSVSGHQMSFVQPLLQNSNNSNTSVPTYNNQSSSMMQFTPSNNSVFVTPNYLSTNNFSPMYQTQSYIPSQQQHNAAVLQTVPMQATYPLYAYPMSTVPPTPVYTPNNTNQTTSNNGMLYYHYNPQ